MRFIVDHDLHIHSQLSACSSDPEQSTQAILNYAKENGFTHICLTDHFWDEKVPGASNWYKPQNFEHICQALPLPQAEGIRFSFGAETDMDKFFTIGTARETFDRFDFVIIPTTHLHMGGFTIDAEADEQERQRLFIRRLDALLDADIPFHKVGIAHLTCPLILRGNLEGLCRILGGISDAEYLRVFRRVTEKGCGVELNFNPNAYEGEVLETILRPYHLARKAGCRFYLGSDAHHPQGLAAARGKFEKIIDLLDLQEDDKFTVG